jgi:hypothetical protein
MVRSRRLFAFASIGLLAACPVGCPRGKPKTLYNAPEEKVELQQRGRCSFQVMGSMEGRPYPHSDDGFYRFDIDGYPAFRESLTFDPASQTITVRDEACHDGMVVDLHYQPILHTALPE